MQTGSVNSINQDFTQISSGGQSTFNLDLTQGNDPQNYKASEFWGTSDEASSGWGDDFFDGGW